jgi:hypothetical protein
LYGAAGLGTFLSVHPSLPLGSGITLLYANPPAASTKGGAKDDEGQSNRVPAGVLTNSFPKVRRHGKEGK